jgi:hypothetical protein
MCFSAAGSFGVAAVLGGIGAVSLAQEKATSHRMLALVPLLFAAQQVAEGVVWITIDAPSLRGLQELAVAAFLAFALVIWPTWVPLALWAAEPEPRRRRALSILAWVGAAVAVYASVILIRGRPTAQVAGHSIAYSYRSAGPALVLAFYLPMYVIAAVLPFFVSTMSKARIMGSVLAVALVATFIIKRETLTSVWCFFAAILSVVIVLGISAQHRLTIKPI